MKDITFKKITIEDKESIEFYLNNYSTFCLSAFSFPGLVAWETVYHYQWAVLQNTLLIKLVTHDDNKEHFLQPIGEFPSDLQKKIIQYAQSLDYRLAIYGASNTFISKHAEFVSHFEQTEHRDMDDYIYLTEDLALLKGKKYQAKRNLLHQFETSYDWSSEAITPANIPACFEVLTSIYHQNNLDKNSFLAHELNVLTFVLKHFPQFKEKGVLIRIDGRPVAFSIFAHLNASTCVVHFEKAMREYKGLYQLINRETAKIILADGYKYINREEDLGLEGLRKAKLSYHPLELCPAHVLLFIK
ncbi:MAG: DUF2156 domain-containing protein [Bdellovibrio sp.]|nr:DUF2156 domain-containing protein [Bdellovibrio sp.]